MWMGGGEESEVTSQAEFEKMELLYIIHVLCFVSVSKIVAKNFSLNAMTKVV